MATVTSSSSADNFTCTTCHVMFNGGAEQREHYRTDVHKFNSKRKVAGLAPVSAEVYDSKQKGTFRIPQSSPETREGPMEPDLFDG